jgi:hypothetical protein
MSRLQQRLLLAGHLKNKFGSGGQTGRRVIGISFFDILALRYRFVPTTVGVVD